MNAIVPLNIAALRVNNNDATNVVGGLQGLTADFSALPWNDPSRPAPALASTGDKIHRALGAANGAPQQSPLNPLGVGVHLHWQLPDYFRKGTQPASGGNIIFPPAPNRWLVTRFLSVWDSAAQAYGPVTTKSWVVESDYVSPDLAPDADGITRPAITVPLPAPSAFQSQPYMYMGRVLDYRAWDPKSENPANYLPAYRGPDGNALYLTSIGFVGAYFGSYYPECCSVYGFWDHFGDVSVKGFPSLQAALQANAPIQFRASYQVSGWLHDATSDPLADMSARITRQYTDYLNECTTEHVTPALTPNDFFRQIAADRMKWTFNLADVGYTINSDHTIATLRYPQRTISAGTTQEIVWNMVDNPGGTYFLKSNDPGNLARWNSPVEIAVGNSMEEAVAAKLKADLQGKTQDAATLANYEYLLTALQLGMLAGLEATPSTLISLEEALHRNAFATQPGGYQWIIGSQETSDGGSAMNPESEVTLPIELAEQLYQLNRAQKDYDMGRAALSVMRQQLFMDWTHYVKMFNREISDPNISLEAMTDFIATNSGGELNAVIAKGAEVGILSYAVDAKSGGVVGINPPDGSVPRTSLAYQAWNHFNNVRRTLQDFSAWQLQCAKGPAFFAPREPVLLLQGDMIEPPARNGRGNTTFVRLGSELLDRLTIAGGEVTFTVSAGSITGVPDVSAATPMQSDIAALLGEACLITPMLAPMVATALAALGGANNPAVRSAANFTTTLMYAQGGLSPLDLTPNPGGIPRPPRPSLFATLNNEKYQPAANPVVTLTAPQSLTVTFTNGSSNGWPPHPKAWTTQSTARGFPSGQANPFLPVFMIWNVVLNPLKRLGADANGNAAYTPTNLTNFFDLNAEAVDYVYRPSGGEAVGFSDKAVVPYGDSATIGTKSTGVLVYQITSFINAHPNDPDNPTLQTIADYYTRKHYLAQSLSGFNLEQILRTTVPQIAVQNLTRGGRDALTSAVARAAVQTAGDNWYGFGFNGSQPITTGLLAQANFGSLRAGFLEVVSVELVDVFGQRMNLSTPTHTADHSLAVVTSQSLTPPEWDKANAGRIYLTPRVLTPLRLWFQWLSAIHDSRVATDFEAMGEHPAVSPVCGWIVPNHLDNNLFFYDADGAPIGSFGIENLATKPTLQYRTRAGNLANTGTDLEADIGKSGDTSKVNPHLAAFMRYVNAQDADYLTDLMQVILGSASFIKPADDAHQVNLSVLLGRPLALTRAIVGLETPGNLLPIGQSSSTANDVLPQDVKTGRVNYAARIPFSSANLPQVDFPLRLGDLANLDDGLVGYLVEGGGANPYLGSTLYAPAATTAMAGGVQAPKPTTLQLHLNAAPMHLTLLVDPRAPVHATTGVLPVANLAIPADQYSAAMNDLALTFTARPMLQPTHGAAVPLPAAMGHDWSWIAPGAPATTPLAPNAVNESPAYGYSPQTVQEGWLKLSRSPDKA